MPDTTDPNIQSVDGRLRALETMAAAQQAILDQLRELDRGVMRLRSLFITELGGTDDTGRTTPGHVNQGLAALSGDVVALTAKLECLDVALRGTVGSGQPGLLTRLAHLEDTRDRNVWWFRALWGAVAALGVKVIADLLGR